MTRAELEALAARVEAAQGADRALDEAVAEAAGWTRNDIAGLWRRPDTALIALPPHFTASLDAALTLVPDGWTGSVHLEGKALLYRDDNEPSVEGHALTPALALCAAALRARAEDTTDDR